MNKQPTERSFHRTEINSSVIFQKYSLILVNDRRGHLEGSQLIFATIKINRSHSNYFQFQKTWLLKSIVSTLTAQIFYFIHALSYNQVHHYRGLIHNQWVHSSPGHTWHVHSGRQNYKLPAILVPLLTLLLLFFCYLITEKLEARERSLCCSLGLFNFVLKESLKSVTLR